MGNAVRLADGKHAVGTADLVEVENGAKATADGTVVELADNTQGLAGVDGHTRLSRVASAGADLATNRVIDRVTHGSNSPRRRGLRFAGGCVSLLGCGVIVEV
jgi:hypothetical protein